MSAKRRCQAKNKAGQPCNASPLKGKNFCSAHDPVTPPSARFGSRAQATEAGKLGGRPPLPKPTDLARELLERHVYAVFRPHFKALGLELEDDGSVTPMVRGAIMTGESKDGTVVASEIEDLGAQIAAAEKLLDRVYGRPKQTQEISGPHGDPITLTSPTDDTDRSTRAARLLLEAGLLNGHTPAVGDGVTVNGNGNGHH